MTELGSFWKRRSIPNCKYTMPQLPVFQSQTTFRVKLKVYHAAVASLLLYGCETWPLKNIRHQATGFINRRHTMKFKSPDNCEPIQVIIQRRTKIARPCTAQARRSKPECNAEVRQWESWKRRAEGVKYNWRNLVHEELRPHLKLPRMKMKIWEENWFDNQKSAAGNLIHLFHKSQSQPFLSHFSQKRSRFFGTFIS